MCGVGGRILGKEEDCRTDRKKGWGLEKEEEGVKEGEKETRRGRVRGEREHTGKKTHRQSDTTEPEWKEEEACY